MSDHERIREVSVRAGSVQLPGDLTLVPDPLGIVVFVHGSGSSRFSSRNRYVARTLNEAGLATLLFDLLTREEGEVDDYTRELRFDIPMLGERTTATVEWLASEPATRELPVGLFGSSTGAAAALIAAASRPVDVGAVVSRGGRPDLAMSVLGEVRAPTLLVVGGDDGPVIGMNQRAAAALSAPHEVKIIPGASHLFEEPGTLEQVARAAAAWFRHHLGRARR